MSEPSPELAGRILHVLDDANERGAFAVVDDAFHRAEQCESEARSFATIVATLALGIGNAEAAARTNEAVTLLEVLRIVCAERAIRQILDDVLGDRSTP